MMWDQAENLRKIVRSTQIKPKSSVIKADHIRTKKARVITVTSGKGGVGKTNFTVNLALALSKLGKKVAVIDADLGMGNIDLVLGCSVSHTMMDLLEGSLSLQDIMSDGPLGIKFIAGGSGIHELTNLSKLQLTYIFNQINRLDDWADLILIDTGAGISQSVMKFVVAADEVIIITTPEPTAITDAYAMMKTFSSQRGTGVLRLVVNRVFEKNEGLIATDNLIKVASKFLGLSLISLGIIYEDSNLVRAVKKQMPLLLAFPDAISARCIEKIATRLLEGEHSRKKTGIEGFFNQLVGIMR